MSTDAGAGDAGVLSPDEAFAVLGEEARLEILQTLGEADEPLAFSELFDRVAYDDSSNFAYHLDKLVEHFVRKTEAGYELRQAGRRVVEAIVSGAVTEDPILEPTRVDKPCGACSAPVQVAFSQERVKLHCTECDGLFSGAALGGDRFGDFGNHGYIPLPPAGVHGRSAREVLHAAELWVGMEMRTAAKGVCPRCSAAVEHAVSVCEDHDAADGRCAACGRRFAAGFTTDCENCLFGANIGVAAYLASKPVLMGFMIDHGIDPMSPEGFDFPYAAVEEEVRSHRPFDAEYTFTADGEALTLTVDEDLAVVDVTRREVSDADR